MRIASGGAAGGIRQHVAALLHARRRGVFAAVQGGDVLAAEHDGGRAVLAVHGQLPGLGHLVGVARADHPHARHRPQRGQVLDRLVGGAVLAQADGVVGEHEGHRQVVERRQPQRRPLVVGEGEEGGGEGARPAVVGDAVGRAAHGVLAHAVADVAAGAGLPVEVAGVLQVGQRRDRQVGVAAEEPGDGLGHRRDHLLARLAGGQLVLGGEGGQLGLPALGQLAGLGQAPLGRQLGVGRRPGLEALLPLGLGLGALARPRS